MSEKYEAQSVHYFRNARASIEAGDAEKAGEFLWGAMAEALKAVAAKKGRKLKHGQFGYYARQLAKELEDESIFEAFGNAETLHGRFYEGGLGMDEVYTYAERIGETVAKLLKLTPEEDLTKGS